MDIRLAKLVDDYIAAVAQAVKILEDSGIPRPKSISDWLENEIPSSGIIDGGVYFKHGFGCAVRRHGRVVDFDFGEFGEIDGLTVDRIISYASPDIGQYGFENDSEIKTLYKTAIENGSLRYSGYILYYKD
jgi:hypothetical protein